MTSNRNLIFGCRAYIWYRYVHASSDFWGCFNFSEQGADVAKIYSFVENVVKDNVSRQSIEVRTCTRCGSG